MTTLAVLIKDKWSNAGIKMGLATKNAVAKIFLTQIVGLNEDDYKAFLALDMNSRAKVRSWTADAKDLPTGVLKLFWDNVNKMWSLHDDQEIKYLTETANLLEIYQFMDILMNARVPAPLVLLDIHQCRTGSMH